MRLSTLLHYDYAWFETCIGVAEALLTMR